MAGANARLQLRLALLVACVAMSAAWSTTYPLNFACALPTAYGGTANCTSFCRTNNTSPSCAFSVPTPNPSGDLMKLKSTTCTQSTDPRCTSTALQAMFGGYSQIIAAYCTDKFLVIMSNGAPNHVPNLHDVLNPPGGVVNGVACVTRDWAIGSSRLYKIPLNYTLLSTSVGTNNIANWGNSSNGGGYLVSQIDSTIQYGLPSAGAAALTIWGQEMFPVFNNRGLYTPEACETDSCNEHVGQGGGTPHLHGDPFGPKCSYSSANYTAGAHPPQIGFSFDGPTIFGRYLDTSSPGYNVSLDDCGGHVHDAYVYHYHTQVVDAFTDAGAYKDGQNPTGQAYALQTVGVFKCWKSNISLITDFFDTTTASREAGSGTGPTYSFCAGSTNYYLQSGYTAPTAWTTATSTSTGMGSTTPSSTPSGSSKASPAKIAAPTAEPGDTPVMEGNKTTTRNTDGSNTTVDGSTGYTTYVKQVKRVGSNVVETIDFVMRTGGLPPVVTVSDSDGKSFSFSAKTDSSGAVTGVSQDTPSGALMAAAVANFTTTYTIPYGFSNLTATQLVVLAKTMCDATVNANNGTTCTAAVAGSATRRRSARALLQTSGTGTSTVATTTVQSSTGTTPSTSSVTTTVASSTSLPTGLTAAAALTTVSTSTVSLVPSPPPPSPPTGTVTTTTKSAAVGLGFGGATVAAVSAVYLLLAL